MHIVDIKHTYSTKEIVQVSKYMHSSGDSAREMKGYECGLKKGWSGVDDEGVLSSIIFFLNAKYFSSSSRKIMEKGSCMARNACN